MDIFYTGQDRWFNDVLVREGQNWIEGDRLSRLLAHPEWVQSNAPVLPTVEVVEQLSIVEVTPPVISVVEILDQSSVSEVDPPPKNTRAKK